MTGHTGYIPPEGWQWWAENVGMLPVLAICLALIVWTFGTFTGCFDSTTAAGV